MNLQNNANLFYSNLDGSEVDINKNDGQEAGFYYIPDIDTSEKHPTQEKIEEFRLLNQGWHYGEGRRIDENTIKNAIHLHNFIIASDFGETDVFPGLNGEIRLTTYYEDYYIECTFENDLDISFLVEKSGEEIFSEENLTINDAMKKISSYRSKLCDSLELLPSDFTIEDSKDFRVWLLETHQTEAESLYLTRTALNEPLEVFAHI